MNQTKLFSRISVLIILSMLMTGCAAPKPAALSNQQVTDVTAYFLTAIDTGDYAAFTRDFSDVMVTAFPEDKFLEMKALLATTSGKYVSIGAPDLYNKQGYALYQFVCKYEKEDVVVTVTLAIDGDKVDGLFFTSPGLIKASK